MPGNVPQKNMMEDHILSFEQVFFIVLCLTFFFALIFLFFYIMYTWIRNNGHCCLFGGNRNSSSNDEPDGHRNRTDDQNDSNRNPRRIRNRSDDSVTVNINLNQGSGGRERLVIRAELAAVLLHVQQLENQRTERTETIGRLPQPVSYRSYERTMNSTECAICLEEFSGDDECRVLPFCKHIYHMGCIDRWLMEELTCPICRTDVTEHA